jgi:hypothetical protein
VDVRAFLVSKLAEALVLDIEGNQAVRELMVTTPPVCNHSQKAPGRRKR